MTELRVAGSPARQTIEAWLAQATGLEAALLGPHQLERAVAQRCQERGLVDPQHYAALVLRDAQEQQALLERLVVGESWFLREPQAFALLVNHAQTIADRPLRLLSCGCASGEEPYSAVIALLEGGWRREELQVEAIDLSERALARAAAAHYGRHALRSLEPGRLERHFEPSGPGWRLRAELRGSVRFHQGTLQQRLADLPGGWHALICRNVMIYLQPSARTRLLTQIAERLAPGGLLQVAIAEAPLVPSELFERQAGAHGGSFRRRERLWRAGVPATRSAVARSTAAVDGPSLDPAHHLEGARRLQARGRRQEALEALRRCLYLDPHHLEALNMRLQLARASGEGRDAERQRQRLERARNRRAQP